MTGNANSSVASTSSNLPICQPPHKPLLEASVPIRAARYLRIFNPSWIAMLRGTSRPLGAELSQLGRLSK